MVITDFPPNKHGPVVGRGTARKQHPGRGGMKSNRLFVLYYAAAGVFGLVQWNAGLTKQSFNCLALVCLAHRTAKCRKDSPLK